MPQKVLLVDDVNMFLELMKGFLKLSSVHVLTASDGAKALEIARREVPALVFMDLHMPNMGGDECCARIKADPALKSIPVVMLTADGKEEDRALCIKSGCDDYLTKPIDRNLFLDKARHFIPSVDRRDKRVPCVAKVKFRVFGITLSGDVVNMSEHGIYVAATCAVELGTTMDLVFALPDGKGSVVQTKGRIAWVNSGSKRLKGSLPEGFGVEFVAMTEESTVAVHAFMAGAG